MVGVRTSGCEIEEGGRRARVGGRRGDGESRGRGNSRDWDARRIEREAERGGVASVRGQWDSIVARGRGGGGMTRRRGAGMTAERLRVEQCVCGRAGRARECWSEQ